MIGLFLRKCQWLHLLFLSFGWAILANICYRDYLSGKFPIDVLCIYASNGGSLLYFIIFYLSYGLPMSAILIFLNHALCEEYYYSRVKHRFTVMTAKILVIVIVNISILLAELFCLYLCAGKLYFERLCLYDLWVTVGVMANLLLPRLMLAFMFLILSTLKGKLMILFTVMTGILFFGFLTNTLFNIDTVISWFDVSRMSQSIIVTECILTGLMIYAVFYLENKRDISLQEDIDKNDE